MDETAFWLRWLDEVDAALTGKRLGDWQYTRPVECPILAGRALLLAGDAGVATAAPPRDDAERPPRRHIPCDRFGLPLELDVEELWLAHERATRWRGKPP